MTFIAPLAILIVLMQALAMVRDREADPLRIVGLVIWSAVAGRTLL